MVCGVLGGQAMRQQGGGGGQLRGSRPIADGDDEEARAAAAGVAGSGGGAGGGGGGDAARGSGPVGVVLQQSLLGGSPLPLDSSSLDAIAWAAALAGGGEPPASSPSSSLPSAPHGAGGGDGTFAPPTRPENREEGGPLPLVVEPQAPADHLLWGDSPARRGGDSDSDDGLVVIEFTDDEEEGEEEQKAGDEELEEEKEEGEGGGGGTEEEEDDEGSPLPDPNAGNGTSCLCREPCLSYGRLLDPVLRWWCGTGPSGAWRGGNAMLLGSVGAAVAASMAFAFSR